MIGIVGGLERRIGGVDDHTGKGLNRCRGQDTAEFCQMRATRRATKALADRVAEAASQVKSDQLAIVRTDLVANTGIRDPVGDSLGVMHLEILIDRHPQP